MLRYVGWDTYRCIQIRWVLIINNNLHLIYDQLHSWPILPTTYTCAISLDYLIASILLHYYIVVKEKTDYINSDYSDVRYRVYIWGFPCLDYSFDVLISLIGNVSLYNWFPVVTLLTVLLHIHTCLYSRYTFPVHMYLLCTPPGFIVCTRWGC